MRKIPWLALTAIFALIVFATVFTNSHIVILYVPDWYGNSASASLVTKVYAPLSAIILIALLVGGFCGAFAARLPLKSTLRRPEAANRMRVLAKPPVKREKYSYSGQIIPPRK